MKKVFILVLALTLFALPAFSAETKNAAATAAPVSKSMLLYPKFDMWGHMTIPMAGTDKQYKPDDKDFLDLLNTIPNNQKLLDDAKCNMIWSGVFHIIALGIFATDAAIYINNADGANHHAVPFYGALAAGLVFGSMGNTFGLEAVNNYTSAIDAYNTGLNK